MLRPADSFACVRLALFGWRRCTCLLGHGLGKLEVNITEALGYSIVHGRVLPMVKLEA